MKVVSDTGPIIALAKLRRLDILVSLFSTVLIPPMVHRELMGKIGLYELPQLYNIIKGDLLLKADKYGQIFSLC